MGNKTEKIGIVSVMEKAVEWAITFMLGVMVLNVAVAVFSRYVLNHSFPWAEELGRYLMIWTGYLGASLAMKSDEHIGLTVVVSALQSRLRKWVVVASRIIVEVFLIVILINSFKHLSTLSIQRSSAMEIPMAIPYFSVTAGTFLMAVEELIHIVRDMRKKAK